MADLKRSAYDVEEPKRSPYDAEEPKRSAGNAEDLKQAARAPATYTRGVHFHPMTTSTYSVEGMTCDHCVAAVTEEVSKLPGVSSVTVDVGSGRVEVTSVEPLPRDEVAAAVVEAGYVLRS